MYWPALAAGSAVLLFAGTAFAQDAVDSFDAAQAQQALIDLQNQAAAGAVAASGAAAIGIGLIIFWVIFGGIGFILWLWALIDVIRRQFKNQNDKILWLVLVLVIPWIGSIAYLIAGRKSGTIPA
jgi:hypothetical protein